MDDNKFKFSGLPKNEDIEIEDQKEKTKRTPRNSSPMFGSKSICVTADMLKSILGDDFENLSNKEILDKLNLMSGEDINKMLEQFTSGLFSKNNLFGNANNCDDEEEDEDVNEDDLDKNDDYFDGDDELTEPEKSSEKNKFIFELGKVKHLLNPENFAKIPCKIDHDLHIKFVKKYGLDEFEMNKFDPNMNCHCKDTELFQKFKTVKVVDYNEKFILLYGQTENKNEQGAYFAVIENGNDEFEIVFPEYGNTYNSETESFYDITKTPEAFDNKNTFVLFDLAKIKAGLDFLLVPIKYPFTSPLDFGKIIQISSNASDSYTRWIRIGLIDSNESTESKIFKKDFDLDTEKTKFDFYFLLPNDVHSTVIDELVAVFKEIDLNSCMLMQNSELKVKNDKIYVDLDLNELTKYLPDWWPDEGNSEI